MTPSVRISSSTRAIRLEAGVRPRSGASRRLFQPLIFLAMLLLATLSSSLLPGCAAERALVREKEQNRELLNRSATAYWHAVRWNYHDKAAEFVEDGPQRGELWEYLLEREGKAGINEPTVYRVDLEEGNQSGIAWVSYQLLLSNGESVEERRIRQKWYLKRGHWYLKLEPDELKRLD